MTPVLIIPLAEAQRVALWRADHVARAAIAADELHDAIPAIELIRWLEQRQPALRSEARGMMRRIMRQMGGSLMGGAA